MSNYKELLKKDDKALASSINELVKEHFALVQEKLSTGVKKSHRLGQIRKEIAQLKTIAGSRGK